MRTFSIDERPTGERPASHCDAKKGRESGAAACKPDQAAPSFAPRTTCENENALAIIRPYIPASWFHERGLRKVLTRLEPRLPSFTDGLFLTFTFDPKKFEDPASAFEAGRDRLRRVFFKLRHGIKWEGKTYAIDAPYCVKVEFHANGWAHFHVVFLSRRFLPGGLLNEVWGFGRTNVQRITNDRFRYLLKYVTKGGQLPEWVKARSRLRVFQSSRGFLRPIDKPVDAEPEDSKPKRRRRCTHSTIGQRVERWSRTALLQQGERFSVLSLPAPYRDLFDRLVFPAAQEGRYLGGGHILINDRRQMIDWLCPETQNQSAA